MRARTSYVRTAEINQCLEKSGHFSSPLTLQSYIYFFSAGSRSAATGGFSGITLTGRKFLRVDLSQSRLGVLPLRAKVLPSRAICGGSIGVGSSRGEDPSHALFAVGTSIAGRPPHRSGRKPGSEHPAPYLRGVTGEAPLEALAARGPAPGSRAPGSGSGACFAGPRSPWSPPLGSTASRRRCPGFVRRLHSYYGGVRLLLIVHRRLRLLTFPPRTIWPRGLWPTKRSPGSRTRSVRACQVLRPRRAVQTLALARLNMSPSATQTASAPGISFLSRLNGWPARSPADASPTSSRTPAHGLGPMWFATPSS